MRYETGTFELRDNDMMVRELSSAETDEVAGGVGTAIVEAAASSSGAGSSLVSNHGSFTLATTNTSALAAISGSFAVTGPHNTIAMAAAAAVS